MVYPRESTTSPIPRFPSCMLILGKRTLSAQKQTISAQNAQTTYKLTYLSLVVEFLALLLVILLRVLLVIRNRMHMDDRQAIAARPLSELTLGEVLPYLRRMVSEEIERGKQDHAVPAVFSGIMNSTMEHYLKNPHCYTIGLKGLAELLHCSVKTAYNYKRSGLYDPAIHKIGKRYLINKEIALEIATGNYKGTPDT